MPDVPGAAAPPRSLHPTVALTIAAPSNSDARERPAGEPTRRWVGSMVALPQNGHGADFTWR